VTFDPTMLNKQQLQEYLWSVGLMPVEGMLIVDERYVFPTEEWVRNSFLPAWAEYKRNLDQAGISMRWKAEVKDCDNVAAKMADYAADLHARKRGRGEPAALVLWLDGLCPSAMARATPSISRLFKGRCPSRAGQ
jgi:hypothetical protein